MQKKLISLTHKNYITYLFTSVMLLPSTSTTFFIAFFQLLHFLNKKFCRQSFIPVRIAVLNSSSLSNFCDGNQNLSRRKIKQSLRFIFQSYTIHHARRFLNEIIPFFKAFYGNVKKLATAIQKKVDWLCPANNKR